MDLKYVQNRLESLALRDEAHQHVKGVMTEDFGDGVVETYVYSADHNSRVQITHETVFRFVEKETQS